MIRSTNRELGEYEIIRHPEHVVKVWHAVESALPKYWAAFVNSGRKPNMTAELSAKVGKTAKLESERDVLARIFEEAVSSYEKEAEKYRRFFEPEALEEFHDDPNSFKQALARDVPVIHNTLRQRRAELKEWQMHFRTARANDLLEVFANVIDFIGEWSEQHPSASYPELTVPLDFGLDPLDDDESMSMANVIGMGIKSIVLFHLDPERLPLRGRYGLYGLFFLSGKGYFGLPSKTSEFLMVNDLSPASDGSIIMDQNYWYPYGLFCCYALRIYRWIETQVRTAGLTLDQSVRYVYVERFFRSVCDHHAADLKTMRAHERFEVPT